MNSFSCCSACSATGAEKIFSLGSYMPYEPGYGHSFGGMNPVGVAGPLMGKPVARPYPGQSPLPVGSVPTMYDRGEGNPRPYYSLPTFNGYASTGDPAGFNPLSSYNSTGSPCGFNPLSSYPSPSNPMGSISPLGESMPANIGHPYRVGGEAVGGMVSPLFDYTDEIHSMGRIAPGSTRDPAIKTSPLPVTPPATKTSPLPLPVIPLAPKPAGSIFGRCWDGRSRGPESVDYYNGKLPLCSNGTFYQQTLPNKPGAPVIEFPTPPSIPPQSYKPYIPTPQRTMFLR